jgi:hypothetical protein
LNIPQKDKARHKPRRPWFSFLLDAVDPEFQNFWRRGSS